ncbi:MAG: class I SAM-dependent methyltransferase [Bacteroidia bacterium]|nr:class I SAM-dependent methyltransferase [Bacteroidia bacterium]
MTILEASHSKIALRHPFAALSFYFGHKSALHEAIIIASAKYLWGDHTDTQAWKSALQELKGNVLIPPVTNRYNLVVGNSLNTTFGKWIWCCVRVLKPEVMIETGVAHGSSSWIILNAMHLNKKGRLYSIDLPNNDTNAAYNFNENQPATGWMVPDLLKPRWELHLGYAQEVLPMLLRKTGQTDIFFHDSDHSYAHMKFEFETAAPLLRSGGLLISDDVHKNTAFEEFIRTRQWKALQFNKGGSAIAP